jgi:predicted nucleic acid-binding protein
VVLDFLLTAYLQAEILLSEDMQDGLIIDEQLTIVNPFVAR